MNLMPLRDAGGFQAASGDGILGVRPEDLILSKDAPAGGLALDLRVEAIEHVGAETYVYGIRSLAADAPTVSAKPGELPPGEVIVRVPGTSAPGIGQRIRAVTPRAKLHLFSADGRSRIEL
jgi:sn-glycerol 3-phosphate transport system ATP-binding protein